MVAGLAVLTALFLTPSSSISPRPSWGPSSSTPSWASSGWAPCDGIAGLRRDGFAFALFTLFAVLFLGVLSGLVLAVSLSWRCSWPGYRAWPCW